MRRRSCVGFGREALQDHRVAQQEFEEAAAWYEHEEIGLGFEFIEEVDRVLARIETHEKFVTAPERS